MKKILLTSIVGALFATSAFAQSSNFNVINSIIYDGSYDFSDKKMDSHYQKVANSNNLGGNISLGYVDLNTLDSSYDKKTYAFFAVNGKSKEVSIANILMVDKDNTQNTPNVNIYAINKNEIAVCAKPKQSVYWFGQAGMGYETFLDNQKSKDGECLTFYMDENYWNNNPTDFEQAQLKSAKIVLDVNKIYTTPKTDYKLNGCTTKANINKDYCNADVADLDKVLEKSKEIKPNFNNDKKLVQLFYKNKENKAVADIFVVDDKKKQIYLKSDFATFSDSSIKKYGYTKAPYVITTKSSDTFCLYSDGAKFNTHVSTIEKKGNQFDLVCSSFNTNLPKNFTEADILVYDEYISLFNLKGKKDISWLK